MCIQTPPPSLSLPSHPQVITEHRAALYSSLPLSTYFHTQECVYVSAPLSVQPILTTFLLNLTAFKKIPCLNFNQLAIPGKKHYG